MAEPNHVQKSSRWRLRFGERRILLLIGDLFVAFLALGVALYYWSLGEPRLEFFEFLQIRPQAWFFLLPFAWPILLVELYDPHRATNLARTTRGVLVAVVLGVLLYMGIYFTYPPGRLPRRGVVGFFVLAGAFTALWRLLYIRVFTAPRFRRKVLLVGAGSSGQALLNIIVGLKPPPFHVVGLIDDDPQKIGTEIQGYKVLGGCGDLLRVIAAEEVLDILVAISGKMGDKMFQTLLEAQELGVEITRMPVVYEELLGRVPINYLEADWILRSFVDEARVSGFYEMAKRFIDILGGLVGVLILAVITPPISLGILLESGRPIVFDQTRAGKGGVSYRIKKFRTMYQGAESGGKPRLARADDERTTPFGRFLRRTHLDEWPQFINVLRGEMSLVGPRPERPELVEQFQERIPFYRARLLVKPGIAGWAQVNFGYAATLEEMAVKLENDLYYIKHRNVLLDIIIIIRTIGTVFGFRGR